ncbi:YtxH domain-containing protein [Sporosarcina sp. SAFN-010]|uniref:YtxH domain-containing protein n=1 Tax=Sporosarcina sp. SAFN-010 TaxID=3387273 RepID=UPI003F81B3E8
MSENYNKPNQTNEFTSNDMYENSYGEPSQLPMNYNYFPTDTDSFYEEDSSGSGSFLVGALVGGVIGAAAALFLAPKTGKEMRDDFSTQAVQFKNKSIELSSTAKDKAVDLTATAKDKAADLSSTAKEKATQISAVAKEKSEDLKKNVQDQTGKVKSMTSKKTAPMDDGTASSEGEEPIVNKEDKGASKMSEEKKEASNQTTKNSDVAYDNSENIGKDKNINQNAVSNEKPKSN